MNYRGEHKEIARWKINSNASLCSLRFIFILFLFPLFSYSEIAITDTAKNQYPLNDPRNPNCPCHKYQKLAEDEFRNQHTDLSELNKTIITNQINSIDPNKTNSLNENAVSNNLKHSKKIKFVLKKNRTIKKAKFRILKKKIRKHNMHTDYSACFKW